MNLIILGRQIKEKAESVIIKSKIGMSNVLNNGIFQGTWDFNKVKKDELNTTYKAMC